MNNMVHATYIAFMQSEQDADLGRVWFLADSNSWNKNGTPNLRTVRQMLRNTEPDSDNVRTQLSVLFQLVIRSPI